MNHSVYIPAPCALCSVALLSYCLNVSCYRSIRGGRLIEAELVAPEKTDLIIIHMKGSLFSLEREF